MSPLAGLKEIFASQNLGCEKALDTLTDVTQESANSHFKLVK